MHGVAFLSCIHTGGSVLLLRRNLVKEGVAAAKKFRKRETRGFEDDVFIENTRLVVIYEALCFDVARGQKEKKKYASCRWLKDAGLEFTRADLVLSISRGPPGQWFLETE